MSETHKPRALPRGLLFEQVHVFVLFWFFGLAEHV